MTEEPQPTTVKLMYAVLKDLQRMIKENKLVVHDFKDYAYLLTRLERVLKEIEQ